MRSWLANVPKVEARAAALSLGVGVTLMAIKFVAYFLTGSAAIFSDALESIANVAAAAMAMYAIAYAHRPADATHPYGHGKIEFLSSGLEGGMIVVAALAAGIKAIDALHTGQGVQVHRLDVGLFLMAAALIINGAMGWHLIRTGRARHSATLTADGHHLLSDAITSVAAVTALLGVRFLGIWWLDPVAAIVVSFYIAWIGIGLLRTSLGGLMDKQDAHDEALLRGLLDAHMGPDGKPPRICGYHKLRHRHSGRLHWVDFHLHLPQEWDIAQGHQAASAIEHEIEAALTEAVATAHVEPCTVADCPICRPAEARRDATIGA